MAATLDDEVSELRRRLDQALAERDEARAELAVSNSESGERIEQQSATTDVLKVMSTSPGDPQPVFDLITRRAWELCNANGAALYGFDGVLIHLLSAYGTEWSVERAAAYRRQFPMVPTRGTSFGRAILDREVVHIRDIDTDPEVAQFVRDLDVRSAVGVPLLRDGKVIGAISLNSKESGRLSDSQIELLKTFGEQAVIAVTSAETYRELHQRTRDLQESLEYQTATSDVLKVISRSPVDLDAVLHFVCETAARLCRVERGEIFLLEGGIYRWATGFGLEPAYLKAEQQAVIAPGTGTLVGRVALACEAVQILDAMADPLYEAKDELRLMRQSHTVLGVPLLRDRTVIGVICLGRQSVEAFTNQQIDLVTTFAAQAVIAMDNARQITETREALKQQTATAEVLQIINSSPGDLAPVFDAILEKAHALCGAASGGLMLIEGNRYRAVAVHGEPSLTEYWLDLGWIPFPTGEGTLFGRLSRGEVVHLRDATIDDGTPKSDQYHRLV